MPNPIVINQLSKRYTKDSPWALSELSLEVKTGEIYGFLGANGAGKSTTIRLLLNFLQPTSGGATLMDYDVVAKAVEVKRHVGYLSGDVALYQKATGRELLDYLEKLQGKRSGTYRQLLEKRFEADLDKPVAELSKGNRQKIGIIQACMHQPDVLILDEPTSGLDPLMQEAFYETLTESKQTGTAVFMSSHNLAEAQRVCDRVGIIKHGKLIREQTIADDISFGKPVLRVVFALHDDLSAIKKSASVKVLSQFDSNGLALQPTDTIAAALKTLSQYDIRDLKTTQPDLEDEFLEFYGDGQ